MIYRTFQDKELSLLGFGTMRLPMLEGAIDEAQVEQMVEKSIKNGVNYFDTAYPYHGGEAERVIGRVLAKYPRDSYYLATKYPGHQISESYDPAAIFEEQLQKCGVEYFDFYLLHNVYENSIDVYMDEQWHIIEYFREQKRQGRIRHLGFSTHGSLEVMEKFLDYCGDDMEFCQIQLNYLDWTLQNAKEKYEMLTSRGISVIVMEPVRGGKLANLDEAHASKLAAARPKSSIASWAFRFLQDLDNVKVILSGMSDIAQAEDNLKTFREMQTLSEDERAMLLNIAEALKDAVPCTACRYCCDDCPQGLDIPMLLSIYNDLRFSPEVGVAMRLEGFADDKQPSACIKCGKCAKLCPQAIDIPAMLSDLTEIVAKLPKWTEICRQREAANKR